MAEGKVEKRGITGLLRVLHAHYETLVAARSDAVIVKQYAALLRFLKSNNGRFLGEEPSEAAQHSRSAKEAARLNEGILRAASLDDVAKLVNDEATSRKTLELIAIERFSVPRGSMRSFSNKRMLVDKLLTLIDNERTHETIGAVARAKTN